MVDQTLTLTSQSPCRLHSVDETIPWWKGRCCCGERWCWTGAPSHKCDLVL